MTRLHLYHQGFHPEELVERQKTSEPPTHSILPYMHDRHLPPVFPLPKFRYGQRRHRQLCNPLRNRYHRLKLHYRRYQVL